MHRRFLSRALYSCAPVVLFEGDDGTKPGGSGAGNPDPVDPKPKSDEKPDYKALALAAVTEVLAAQSVNGDQQKALEVLAGRNVRLEEDREKKDQEIGRLKTQIPDSEKAQADAAELASWRALAEKGIKKPEDVTTLITENDDFKGKEAKRERDKLRDKAARAAGYDPEKFSALKDVDGWDYEFKTEKVNNENVEVPYVKVKDEKGVEESKPLTEMVAKKFPGLADSIKAADGEGGASHVQQGSGGSGAGSSRFEAIRDKNKKEAEKTEKPAAPLEEIMNIGTNALQ